MDTNFCYLIFDSVSRSVLTKTDSSGAVMAVLLSSPNFGSMSCEKRWLASKNFAESEFEDLEKFYIINFKNKISHIERLPDHFITSKLRTLRSETILRLKYHSILINKTNSLINLSAENYGIIDFGDTIIYELLKCKPEENYYSDAIKNYALGSGISDQGAYNELKTHIDNISHQRMRSMGLYLKYRDMLNLAPASPTEQQKIIDAALDAYFFNAQC